MQPRSQVSCQCACICLVDVPAAISLKRLKVICATAILHIASMGNQPLQLHVTLPPNTGVGPAPAPPPPPFPPAPPAPEPTMMFPVTQFAAAPGARSFASIAPKLATCEFECFPEPPAHPPMPPCSATASVPTPGGTGADAHPPKPPACLATASVPAPENTGAMQMVPEPTMVPMLLDRMMVPDLQLMVPEPTMVPGPTMVPEPTMLPELPGSGKCT